MRVSILVNSPWSSTAYANMARLFAPRLKAVGHAVSMTSLWGLAGGMLDWQGIPVYPRGTENWSGDVQGAHATHWRADVFMSWCDLFVVEPKRLNGIPWSPWFPVDSDPVPPLVVERVQEARWPLVYSRWGEKVARIAGLNHIRYVPPGIDTATFTIQDKTAARERVKLPADRYIVGVVQANIDKTRKGLPEQMAGFKLFQSRYPDALLYLHTNKFHQWGGWDLVAVCKSLGLVLGRDVIFAPQYEYAHGMIGHDDLAALYNSFDVLLACSRAEGFGIPIVEAAACGTPAITGNWSSMSELDFSGLAHPAEDAERIYNPFDSWWWLPRANVIAHLLQEAYFTDRWDRQELRQQALPYDVDEVMANHWLPVLTEMEAELAGEKVTA